MPHLQKLRAALGLPRPPASPRASRAERSRCLRAAALLACLFSVCLLVGAEIRASDSLGGIVGSWAGFALFLLRFAGLSALLCAALWSLFRLALRSARSPIAPEAPEALESRRRIPPLPLLWAGIALCWLPYYLALFPGCMTLDSMYQLEQALGTMPPNDWHPIMHTAFIAVCVWASRALGAPQACVAFYSALQSLALSGAFAYAAREQLRLSARSRRYAWLLYAWFALFPAHPLLSLVMWKDVPHACVTLLLVTRLLALARDPLAAFSSRRRMAALAVLLLLFATLRHNGLYVCALFLPFFLWRCRAHWKRALALCLGVCALILTYRGPVLWALNPLPGSAVELLSVPAQFVARVASSKGDELPPNDIAAIAELLPYERIGELYNPRNADPIKSSLDAKALRSDPARYAALLARLAWRYPLALLESFLCGSSGYWDPKVSYVVTTYGMMPNSAGIERHSMGIADHRIEIFVENRLRRMPGVSRLFGIGGMAWLIAAAAALLWVKRRGELLTPFALLLLVWLTVLASPIYAEYRYAYGLIVCAPVCLGAALAATPRSGPE